MPVKDKGRESWMGIESLQAMMQICSNIGQSNGGPWSKDCSLEEPYIGQKWPSPGTPAMLSHWLGLPGKKVALA